jgi:hypothetical protein
MRRLVQFLLVGCFLIIPAIAQRRDGFHGGSFVDPGFRGDGLRGYRGGYVPGNRFVGFGFPGDWLDYSAGWDSLDYGYTNPYFDNLSYARVVTNPYYEYGPSAPAKVTVYSGPGPICPQTNGKPLYRIAIPANEPARERKVQLTYQNNLWVAHDYSYTNGILNFVTPEGEQKKTPVSSIDRALTLQLNRECGVNFEIPK